MVKQREILVTAALPYANGPIHLGHMLEYIQADIWARFQKTQGHRCYYICADDAHGSAIMLQAKQLNITPESLIAKIQQQHCQDFSDFNIDFDHYHSTHSAECQQLVELIYNKLHTAGYITTAQINQLYDPKQQMFLPDRFIKGHCPKCEAKDQYGDNCEQCGAIYRPTELKNPYSVISGTIPTLRNSEHYFFKLPALQKNLQQWISSGVLQPEVSNKLTEWFTQGLNAWDISRDAPYFGFAIPGAKDKFFYVWLDAPIGYMGSFSYLCQQYPELDFDRYWKSSEHTELYHFIGKDIIYFHALFWPAILESSGFRKPSNIFVHGYVTINGAKMSKSRGTFITARSYLNHLDPDYLRYYYATKLNSKIGDIDLNLTDFVQKVNVDLVGKFVNIASRTAGFINKQFASRLSQQVHAPELLQEAIAAQQEVVTYYQQREFGKAIKIIMLLADKANQYIAKQAPWQLMKQHQQQLAHQVCSMAIFLFRILAIYLKPIIPDLIAKINSFFNEDLSWHNINSTPAGKQINIFKPMINRITDKQITAIITTEQTDTPQQKINKQ